MERATPHWFLFPQYAYPSRGCSTYEADRIGIFCMPRVRALALEPKYEDAPSLAEFARERAELEIEMENRWAKIGRSRVPPLRRKAKL